MLSKKKMGTLLPLKNSLKQENMRNWVKVMCGRQLEALASAKAGEAAAAAAATPPASLAPESQKLDFPHFTWIYLC